MSKEGFFVVIEVANIVNAVSDHGDTIGADAECEALPLFGVETASLEDFRSHHSGAKNFKPRAFEEDVDFGTGCCEWEEAWAKLELDVIAEKTASELVEGPFEVGETDVFVDGDGVDLMEDRVVGSVDGIAAVASSAGDGTDGGRAVVSESMHLECGGMSAHDAA